MTPQRHAQAVKDAVDKACAGHKLVSPGARIEEILGMEIPNYPDEIMPMHLLPNIDGLRFFGWTPDFHAVLMEQASVAMRDGRATECIQIGVGDVSPEFIVGWKPIRRAALTVMIEPA